MPILLILALGASAVFIAMRAAEAAGNNCPEVLLTNTIITMIAAMRAAIGEGPKVSPAAMEQAKEISEECKSQLATLVEKRPVLKATISNLSETVILKGRAPSTSINARLKELKKERFVLSGALKSQAEILKRRDKAFLPK